MSLLKAVHNNKLYETHVANLDLPFGVYRGRKFVLLSPDDSIFRKFLFYVRKLFRIIKTDESSIDNLHQISEKKVNEYPPVKFARKFGHLVTSTVEQVKTTVVQEKEAIIEARDRVIEDLRRGHETIVTELRETGETFKRELEKIDNGNKELVAKLQAEITDLKEKAKKKLNEEKNKLAAELLHAGEAFAAEKKKLQDEHDKTVATLKEKVQKVKQKKLDHEAQFEKNLNAKKQEIVAEYNQKKQEYVAQFEKNLNAKKQEIVEAEKEISSLGRDLDDLTESCKTQILEKEEAFKKQINELKAKAKTKRSEHHHSHSREINELKKKIAELESANPKDAVFSLIREMNQEDQLTCVSKFISDLNEAFPGPLPPLGVSTPQDLLFAEIRMMERDKQAGYVKELISELKHEFPHHTLGKKAVSFKHHHETEGTLPPPPSPVDPISDDDMEDHVDTQENATADENVFTFSGH